MDPEVFDAKVQSAKIYNTYLNTQQKSEKEFDLLAMAQMKFQARVFTLKMTFRLQLYPDN